MKTKAFTPQWCGALSRSLLFFLLSFMLALPVLGQNPEIRSPESKYFIGIGLNTTGYPMKGDSKYRFFGGVTPIVNVHYGYVISKRATIQAGIGYGANKLSSATVRYVSADSVYEVFSQQQLRGVVVPVTFKFTPFTPYKRLQLYINASMVPVIGYIKAEASESLGGTTNNLYKEESSTFDLVATGGLTLNYKINKRLDGYVDGLFAYKHFQFQRPDRYHKPRSIGIGLNYKL